MSGPIRVKPRPFPDDIFFGSMLGKGYSKLTWTSDALTEINACVNAALTTQQGYVFKNDPIRFDPPSKRHQNLLNPWRDPGNQVHKIIENHLRQFISDNFEVEVRHVVIINSQAMTRDEM